MQSNDKETLTPAVILIDLRKPCCLNSKAKVRIKIEEKNSTLMNSKSTPSKTRINQKWFSQLMRKTGMINSLMSVFCSKVLSNEQAK